MKPVQSCKGELEYSGREKSEGRESLAFALSAHAPAKPKTTPTTADKPMNTMGCSPFTLGT